MKVIIDRFEGEYAVCEKEDKTMIDIERSKIPAEAKEGDALLVEDNKIIIDEEETKKREERIKDLTKDLWI
jgi:hypothetical protein